jgi:hypothetical protein
MVSMVWYAKVHLFRDFTISQGRGAVKERGYTMPRRAGQVWFRFCARRVRSPVPDMSKSLPAPAILLDAPPNVGKNPNSLY